VQEDERSRAGYDRSVAGVLISVFCGGAAAVGGVTALGKLVYDMTHSKLDLGLLGLAEFAPAALLVLVTGAVADRFDKRKVSVGGLAVEGTAAALLALYAHSKPTSTAPIFALVIVFGVGRAFTAPATRALPSSIMRAEDLPWLVARFSATWQAALIVGPVLAGFLYVADPALPFVGMAALLAGASVAIMLVHADAALARAPVAPPPLVAAEAEPPVVESPGGLHDAMEGLRFVRRQPILFGAISLDLFAVLFGGAVALLPAIADDRLHVNAVGLGWLRAAGGIGAAAMTVALARRPLKRRVGRRLLMAVAVFGAFTIVLGITHSFVIAFVAMTVLSAADAVSVFIRATLVPLATPESMRGRVFAVENVFIGASNELGAFESGVAAQALGTPGAVVLGGAATLVIASSWWLLFPALRNVDGFPE
jgi:MFS family permease